METRIVNLSDETDFEKAVSALLNDGWEISSTACGFINSEAYDYQNIYQAIMVRSAESAQYAEWRRIELEKK